MRRRTHRTCTTALLTAALLLLTALPAFAHATFEPAEVDLGATVDVSLLIPNERGDVRTVRVETLVPVGWLVETCGSPTGWTCAATERPDGSTVLDWGVDGPDAEQDAPFELTLVVPTDAPAVVAFPTVQTYEDGEESTWVDEGEPSPAPTLAVRGGAAPAPEPTPDPTPEATTPVGEDRPDDRATPTPDAPVPTSTATDGAEAEPDPSAADTDDGGTVLPWLLGATAVALLVAAGAALARRRGAGDDPSG
ncbi:MAG: DUF1775 domain-containing protein [Actinomycetes bacterium]